MSNLKTKAVLKGNRRSIQSPTGMLEDQITTDELLKNPEKHFRLHGSHLKNREAIGHEINTKGNVVNRIGKKTVIRQTKTKEGIVYMVLSKKKNAV